MPRQQFKQTWQLEPLNTETPQQGTTTSSTTDDENIEDDPRTLAELIMKLPEDRFDLMKETWRLKPNLEEREMRIMLLEEERGWEEGRRKALLQEYESRRETTAVEEGEGKGKGPSCGACGKGGHPEKDCWIAHPELAPDWLREKWEREVGKGKKRGKVMKRGDKSVAEKGDGNMRAKPSANKGRSNKQNREIECEE